MHTFLNTQAVSVPTSTKAVRSGMARSLLLGCPLQVQLHALPWNQTQKGLLLRVSAPYLMALSHAMFMTETKQSYNSADGHASHTSRGSPC
jgi:hypothetical protein